MVTFVKSSNQFKSVFIAALMLLAPSAHAQDTGYAPPPMFDDQTTPMVRPEAKNGYIVEPKVSPNTVLPESMNRPSQSPTVLPRVSVDPDAKRPSAPINTTTTAPVPQTPTTAPAVPTAPSMKPETKKAPVVAPEIKAPTITEPTVSTPTVAAPEKPKMMKPIVEEVYIKRDKPDLKTKETKIDAPKPAKKPAAPASSAESKTQEIKTKPSQETSPAVVPAPAVPATPDTIKDPDPVTPSPKMDTPVRDPKKSAITGPVSMPALPTTSVEAKPTFQPDAQTPNEPTILERQQEKAVESKKDKNPELMVPRPKDGVAPTSFDPGEKGAMKKIIPFQPGQITLPAADTDPIAAGVVKELEPDDRKDWRVQIRSYATAYGSGLASDKRIALNRALSLRSSLITQGVPASKIDVLTEGAGNGAAPSDKIDLYLYAPSAK